jgi:hypothetical protein
MIYIRVWGGLGNQMFQLACAYALALKHNTRVGIALDRINSNRGDHFTSRSFELDKAFDLQDISIVNAEKFRYITDPGRSPYRRLKRKLRRVDCHYEKNLYYNPDVHDLGRETYLEGYFQSYRYFESCIPEILELYRFKTPSAATQRMIDETGHLKKVAVHVRRGDYVSPHNLAVHGVCGPEYYLRAAEIFRNEDIDAFVVVSDDPAWAREHIVYDRKTYYLDWNHGADSWQDMLIISKCNHAIIANSSFSWWGALLMDSPAKKIVAPARWYADNVLQEQTHELIPTSWIRI